MRRLLLVLLLSLFSISLVPQPASAATSIDWGEAPLVGCGGFATGGKGEYTPPAPDRQFLTIHAADGGDYRFNLKGFTSYSKSRKIVDRLKQAFGAKERSDLFVFVMQPQEGASPYYLMAGLENENTGILKRVKYRVYLFNGTPIDGEPVPGTKNDYIIGGRELDRSECKNIKEWLDKITHRDDTYGGYRINDKEALKAAGLIEYKESLADPVGDAIGNVLGWLTDATVSVLGLVQQLVGKTGILNSGQLADDEGITSAWSLMRNVANLFFLLILLTIAFANVARINIEYYAIRALLPRFVMAVVLVNLSFFIAQVVMDFADVLTVAFSSLGFETTGENYEGLFRNFADLGVGLANSLAYIFIIVFALLAGLFLWLLLIVRVLVIWFLVIVSPLAFMANILPATRSLFSGWWNQFIKFVLIAPMVALILKVGEVIANAGTGISTEEGLDQSQLLLAPMFAAFTILLAAIIPTILGGKIMSVAANRIRGAAAFAGARARPYATDTVGRALPGIGAAGLGREQLARLPGGRFLAGRIGTEGAVRARAAGRAGKMEMGHMSNESLEFLAATRGTRSAAGLSAAQELATRNGWGDNNQRNQGIFDKYAWNSDVISDTRKTRPDLLAQSSNSSARALGLSAFRNPSAQSMAAWGGGLWNALAETDAAGNFTPRAAALRAQFQGAAAGWSPYLPVTWFGREGNEKLRHHVQRPEILSLFNPGVQQSVRTQAANAPTVAETPHTGEHPLRGGGSRGEPGPPPPPPSAPFTGEPDRRAPSGNLSGGNPAGIGPANLQSAAGGPPERRALPRAGQSLASTEPQRTPANPGPGVAAEEFRAGGTFAPPTVPPAPEVPPAPPVPPTPTVPASENAPAPGPGPRSTGSSGSTSTPSVTTGTAAGAPRAQASPTAAPLERPGNVSEELFRTGLQAAYTAKQRGLGDAEAWSHIMEGLSDRPEWEGKSDREKLSIAKELWTRTGGGREA